MRGYNHLKTNEIQAILLEDYKVISDICEKHGLKVFVIGGTALGAVREKGFIPWDDDMDIALPRKEHDYIIANKTVFEKEMPAYLKILKKERWHHMVVVDMRYKVRRVGEENEGHIYIDVHPIDGTSNVRFTRWLHSSKIFYNRACYKMCNPKLVWLGKWRPKWQIILIKLMTKCRFLSGNPQKLGERWENSMKKYNYNKQKYVAIYTGKYLYKDVYPKDWFEPGIEMPFEDTIVLAPSGYDNYLHQLYGDYMTPLSESERDCHIS